MSNRPSHTKVNRAKMPNTDYHGSIPDRKIPEKAAVRKTLEEQMKEYTESGKGVQVVPTGKSGRRYKLEKGFAVPAAARHANYPFNAMEVGDSFLEDDPRNWTSVRAATDYFKRRYKMQFRTWTEYDKAGDKIGIRVARIA